MDESGIKTGKGGKSHYACHPIQQNRDSPGEDKQADKTFIRMTLYSHQFQGESNFYEGKLHLSSELLPTEDGEEKIQNGNHHPKEPESQNQKNNPYYLNHASPSKNTKSSSFLTSWNTFNSLSLLMSESVNKYSKDQIIIAKTKADPSRDNFKKFSSLPCRVDKKQDSVVSPSGEEDQSDNTISCTFAASASTSAATMTAIKNYFLKAPICPWNQILSNIFKSWLILILLAIQAIAPATILPGVQGADSTSSTTITPEGLECYVCLPGDKSSHEAKEILKLFPLEGNHSIPDCIAFDSHNAHQFQFTCPPPHNLGCSRQMGTDRRLVSRSCVNFRVNDCKIANGAEYCWCTGNLCNGVKELPTIGVPSNLDSSSTSDYNKNDGSESWKDLTDDEDLLGPNDPYEASGEGPDGGQEVSTPDNNSNTPRPKSGHTSRNGGTHQRKFFAGSNPPASHNNVPPTTAAGVSTTFKISYSSSVPTIIVFIILPALLLLPPRSSSL